MTSLGGPDTELGLGILGRDLHGLSRSPFGKSFDNSAWGWGTGVDKKHKGQRKRRVEMQIS